MGGNVLPLRRIKQGDGHVYRVRVYERTQERIEELAAAFGESPEVLAGTYLTWAIRVAYEARRNRRASKAFGPVGDASGYRCRGSTGRSRDRPHAARPG